MRAMRAQDAARIREAQSRAQYNPSPLRDAVRIQSMREGFNQSGKDPADAARVEKAAAPAHPRARRRRARGARCRLERAQQAVLALEQQGVAEGTAELQARRPARRPLALTVRGCDRLAHISHG